jgi:ankyrin repeat protein
MQRNGTEASKWLLDHGANIEQQKNGDDRTALHLAVLANNSDLVKLLVDRGANTSALDLSYLNPLEASIVYYSAKNPDIVKYLLNHTDYPLFHPLYYNQDITVKILVNNYSAVLDPEVGF